MKTSYYTFTTWNDGAMAAGFDSSLREGRHTAVSAQTGGTAQGGGKVIDLTTWRAANLDEALGEPEELDAPQEPPVHAHRRAGVHPQRGGGGYGADCTGADLLTGSGKEGLTVSVLLFCAGQKL